MPERSSRPDALIADLADRHGFSADAVETMRAAIVTGNGSMAQFSHPEFGGSGQWMRGGMLMIGDMFNQGLKARVDALCHAIVDQPELMHRHNQKGRAAADGRDWWPASLGQPDTSGAQNRMRYAWFAEARRLLIDDGHRITAYDTGTHRIGGVSQQQGGRDDLAFTSQHGTIDLSTLKVVPSIGRLG